MIIDDHALITVAHLVFAALLLHLHAILVLVILPTCAFVSVALCALVAPAASDDGPADDVAASVADVDWRTDIQ